MHRKIRPPVIWAKSALIIVATFIPHPIKIKAASAKIGKNIIDPALLDFMFVSPIRAAIWLLGCVMW
jgi:hypothetical protein